MASAARRPAGRRRSTRRRTSRSSGAGSRSVPRCASFVNRFDVVVAPVSRRARAAARLHARKRRAARDVPPLQLHAHLQPRRPPRRRRARGHGTVAPDRRAGRRPGRSTTTSPWRPPPPSNGRSGAPASPRLTAPGEAPSVDGRDAGAHPARRGHAQALRRRARAPRREPRRVRPARCTRSWARTGRGSRRCSRSSRAGPRRRRRDHLRRPRAIVPQPDGRAAPGHRDGDAGDHARAGSLDRRERLPRPPDGQARRARSTGARRDGGRRPRSSGSGSTSTRPCPCGACDPISSRWSRSPARSRSTRAS